MKKLLIIDDEKDICSMITNFLRKEPYSIREAYNLKDGMIELEDFEPDILVLDNNLPDGQGLNKISYIKKNYPKTKLLLITAFTTIKEQAMANGADGFIAKPFKLSTLVSLL
ncbi:response regulator [Lacihabitans sp. LS3-19]|uniref:response regulator n=1 Tax=Lacihabitans sp. LS3-19 TaxID=2487335 RepID=UPI0020CF25AF|nr:response regulator [Lacihabitans sp. LS3-19]